MLNSQFPMFIAWGPRRTFLYNDAYAPILGEKHPAALGKDFEILWHEIWPDLLPLVELVDNGQAVYQENLRLVMHRNGFDEEVYFTFSYSPVRDEFGKVAGLFCACVETTEIMKSQIAIQKSLTETSRSEAELIDTIESMSDAFFALDKDWKFTRINKHHERIVKKGRDEQLGKSLVDVWFSDPKYQDSQYLKAYRKAMIERVPVAFEEYYEPLKFWTEVRVFPKNDGGIAVFFTDITERKRAQIEFERNVDVSPAILWITDETGTCNYLSQQWYEVTGQTPEQALGFGWLNSLHPDDKRRTCDAYLDANERQAPFSAEYRLRMKSGEYRWVVDAANPRYDRNGKYLGYAGTVFDIHEQKMAAAEIHELNYRFKRSAQVTGLGIWYCDLPFDVLVWSDEVKRHFFLSPDAHVTIGVFYERIHPEDRERVRLTIEKSITGRAAYDIVFRTTNPSDSEETKSIRAVGWTDYDSEGKAIRFDGITLDVTSELRRNAELEWAKNEAERANQLKSSFLSNMSHEIRTPLGAILGFTDLLKDQNVRAEERAQFLETISRNGKALTRIIDDILDLAKVESGKLEVEQVEFSLLDLVDDVMDLFRERTRAKGIYLRAHLGKETPDRIISDPTRLRQILINIVGNAIKFTNEGGVTVDVVGTSGSDANLKFKVIVRDTGIGMVAEQSHRIFQPFMQADNTTTRKFGGTGLGLALSKRLANALKGDVVIESSQPELGSTFLVTFEAAVPSIGHSARPKESHRIYKDAVLLGLKILVADDSNDNLLLVSRILGKQGAGVVTARNGLEAFRLSLAGKYDLVLMDIQMPEMDGYEATRSLRDAGFKKPIIALTAHAMAEERARSYAAGCNGHLTKPLDENELVQMILSNVSRKDLATSARRDH